MQNYGEESEKQEEIYKGKKARLSFYIPFIFQLLKRVQGVGVMAEFLILLMADFVVARGS